MAAREILIPVEGVDLGGDLQVHRGSRGIVLLVHGSGTTRRDRLHRSVARALDRSGFATLLLDLLADYETRDPTNVFDVGMQALRLVEVDRWLASHRGTRGLPLGYFATGVGAGAVLVATARAPERVAAIVTKGGRPDTALAWLPLISAPTLFIDDGVNTPCVRQAYEAAVKKELVAVSGGKEVAQRVAAHASRWFGLHLGATSQAMLPPQAIGEGPAVRR